MPKIITRFNHLCMLLIGLVFLPAESIGANQGHGNVTIQGEINASACTIDTESIYQTINVGNINISNIIYSNGRNNVYPFNIVLINCMLIGSSLPIKNNKYFEVTFDGLSDSGSFILEGQAKGVSLQVMDSSGQIARPGIPLEKNEINSEKLVLNYSIRLVGNNRNVESGEFYTALRYKMDYY